MAKAWRSHNRTWFINYSRKKNIESEFQELTQGIYRFPPLNMDLYPGSWSAKNYKTGEFFELDEALKMCESVIEDINKKKLVEVDYKEVETKLTPFGLYYVEDENGNQSMQLWASDFRKTGWRKEKSWVSGYDYLPFNTYKILAPVPRTYKEFQEVMKGN